MLRDNFLGNLIEYVRFQTDRTFYDQVATAKKLSFSKKSGMRLPDGRLYT